MADSPRGPIHPRSHTGRPVEDQAYAAIERADRLRRRRDSIRAVIGVFVVIPAVLVLAIWLTFRFGGQTLPPPSPAPVAPVSPSP
jgi:hypothetical protein